MRATRLVATLCLALLSVPACAQRLAVEVENFSTPGPCAEEDNVSFALSAAAVGRFRIQALHPPYVNAIRIDSSVPDFSGCNFGKTPHPTDPRHVFVPRTVTLYDGRDIAIVGITFASFWRPHRVPVTVAGRADAGFHLIQVFRKSGRTRTEVLVLYPADGYWRAKPLPARHLGVNAYGSSFLLGPIEQEGRPVVNIARIEIEPQPLAFTLHFTGGGQATVAITEISDMRTALDVRFLPAYDAKRAFAMLRSMYVADDNADASEVTWTTGPAGEAIRKPVMAVTSMQATAVRFGRTVRSRHNTSAPDFLFDAFEAPATEGTAPTGKKPG
ncbi:hypothetical protein C265_04318 [Cupriavidus sp. GA3-3]|uniref:hypothetical protein n=1 Tax=Cupriavidus sp. GA3-3 TaxID=1229514 RepID=UPI0003303B5E|nr:hypothetical protein [Cupriavidus sp. GA3-3]EON21131.1 hypothetical protein C265_04318 [Cupriavidus sp. GA3-3]